MENIYFSTFPCTLLVKIRILLCVHNTTYCLLETHRETENELCFIPEENLHVSGYFYTWQANFTLRSQYTNEDTEFYLRLRTSFHKRVRTLIHTNITKLLVLVNSAFLDNPVLRLKLLSPLYCPPFLAEFQVSKLEIKSDCHERI